MRFESVIAHTSTVHCHEPHCSTCDALRSRQTYWRPSVYIVTLSPLSAVNTVIDMSRYCHVADEEIEPLVRPIFRRVTLIGSNNTVGLNGTISHHWLWLALPILMIQRIDFWNIQLCWI